MNYCFPVDRDLSPGAARFLQREEKQRRAAKLGLVPGL